MGKFYAPSFEKMCASIKDFSKDYTDKTNPTRIRQIAVMQAVTAQAEKDFKDAQKETQRTLHQRVINILTYTREAIRQEYYFSEPNSKLYPLIEKALGIDDKTNQENKFNVVFSNQAPGEKDKAKIAEKSFVLFPEKQLVKHDTKAPQWQVRYFDQSKREYLVQPALTPGLSPALNKLKNPPTIEDKKAVTDALGGYHKEKNKNELDDKTTFVNLIQLRNDIEKDLIKVDYKDFDKKTCLKEIDTLAQKMFNKIELFNGFVSNQPPSFHLLREKISAVVKSDTTGLLSGNQSQLQVFIKFLDKDLSEPLVEEKKNNIATAETSQAAYSIRYGVLLYCCLVYEADYYRCWDFFEEAKKALNISSTTNILHDRFKSSTLVDLDAYITKILADETQVTKIKNAGLEDAGVFLEEMQRRIAVQRTAFNATASKAPNIYNYFQPNFKLSKEDKEYLRACLLAPDSIVPKPFKDKIHIPENKNNFSVIPVADDLRLPQFPS